MITPPNSLTPFTTDPRTTAWRQFRLPAMALQILGKPVLRPDTNGVLQGNLVQIFAADMSALLVAGNACCALVELVVFGSIGTGLAHLRGLGWELGQVVGVELGQLGEELLDCAVDSDKRPAWGDGHFPNHVGRVVVREGRDWEGGDRRDEGEEGECGGQREEEEEGGSEFHSGQHLEDVMEDDVLVW